MRHQSKAKSRVMADHNVSHYISKIVHKINGKRTDSPYGLPLAMQAISPQALLKNFDKVRDFLKDTLGFTTAEREVALRLLRLYAYYGIIYPKAKQVTTLPGCSERTFWRVIKLLKDMNLVTVVNRYVRREWAQISNLYRLDKLVLAIAKYLAERGQHFDQQWLRPLVEMNGSDFWRSIYTPAFAMPPPA